MTFKIDEGDAEKVDLFRNNDFFDLFTNYTGIYSGIGASLTGNGMPLRTRNFELFPI